MFFWSFFFFRDIFLFKLAFHTYETLSNKNKISKRNVKKEELDKKGISDTTTELEISSNLSDESTITIGGPPGPIKEKKIERLDESLDVKLNSYLMKW